MVGGVVRWVRGRAGVERAAGRLRHRVGGGLPVEALRAFERIAEEREPVLWLAQVA